MTREYTNKIYDLLDEGVLDARALASDLLCWLSEDSAKQFFYANCYNEFYPEEEDND